MRRSTSLALTMGVAIAAAAGPAWPQTLASAPATRPGERHRLRTFRLGQQVLPLFHELEAGEGHKGELAIIGDSISFIQDQYIWYLQQHFVDAYGSGGLGFLSPSGLNGDCSGPAYVPCGITLSNSQGAGRGTNSRPRDERHYGLDLDGNIGFVTLSDAGVHGRIFGEFMGDAVTIHYIKENGAGTFQVLVDGQSVAILDASTQGPPEHGEITVLTGATTPSETTPVQVRHVSGGEVLFDGFEMSYGSTGFTFHRLSRNGAGPDDFVHGIGAPTQEFLSTLAPHLTFVMLDWVGAAGHATYRDDMEQILSFYEQSMPNTRFVLITHYAFNTTLEDEADILYELARERGHGYINLYDLYTPSELDSLGFLIDGVHLSALGGAWLGAYIYDTLVQAAAAARTADFTGDQSIDLKDISGFLEGVGRQLPQCDLNADGTVDYADVLAFLHAFDAATH